MSYGDHKLFLYDTSVDLVISSDGLYVDNRPMNNKKLTAHKGLSNEIVFNIRNKDRKLQQVSSDVLRGTMVLPSTGKRIFTRLLTHTGTTGQVKLSIVEGDLSNLDAGLYQLYVSRETPEGTDLPVFADQNNGLKFQIQIDAQVKSEPVETQLANSFTQVANTGSGDPANVFTTSAFFGNQDRNFSHALHSVAIYPNGYSGNITIQGSCIENTPNSDDSSTDWFNIQSNISLSASSSIYHKTFTMNTNWIRILHTPTSGTIDKILVRN